MRSRQYAAMLAACVLAVLHQANDVIAAIYLATALIILGNGADL